MSWLTRLLRRRSDEFPSPAGPGVLLERAIAAYNDRRWAEAEPLFREVIAGATTTAHDREVARNIYGRLLERIRRIDDAIAVYEASVAEAVVGSHPYERLAGIYRTLGRREDELRVLRQTVATVERELSVGRTDLEIPLRRLRGLLREAEGQPSAP